MTKSILFAAIAVVGAVAANAQVYTLDHFNCYQVTAATPVTGAVGLADQFGTSRGTLVGTFRFCNPTLKAVQGSVTPITHPDDHLALYTMSAQAPANLTVLVSNQFGEQQLTVFDPRFLAVPTQKAPHDPPADLDHYKCYRASGQPVGKPAILSDQFHRERVRVLNPVLLCNPVKKRHDTVVTPVLHPEDHLVCYSKTPVTFSTTVDTRNQFGEQKIEVAASDLLCVPSKKQIAGRADVELEEREAGVQIP